MFDLNFLNLNKLLNNKDFLETKHKFKTALSTFEKVQSSLFNFVTVTDDNQYIIIKNINYKKFLFRMNSYYREKKLSNIMGIEYDERSIELYKNKIIAKKDMKIVDFKIPMFFALEVSIIFQELAEKYNINAYRIIYTEIYKKTWINETFQDNYTPKTKLNEKKLDSLFYKPLEFQKEFILSYPELKDRYNLDGFILTFDQGLGKTLTSTLLSACLESKQVIIVCPNSLKFNWFEEINKYYNGENMAYVVNGGKKYNNERYVIVNNESIPKILPYVKSNVKSMLIIDESHNFRNINGKRSKDLINLKNKMKANDVLVMSGTPIKAVPNEIIPALMLIDPLFTDECAEMFRKAFNVSNTNAAGIVQRRFGMIMWRKTKEEVLDLPEKRIRKKKMEIKYSYKYTIEHVNTVVSAKFEEIYAQLTVDIGDKEKMYKNLLEEYYYDKIVLKQYYKYLNDYKEEPLSIASKYHEVDIEFFSTFFRKQVLPLIPEDEQKQAIQIYKDFVMVRKQAMGKALGLILPQYRTDMYCEMIDQNIDEIKSMIENNTAKTVIFSQFLGV